MGETGRSTRVVELIGKRFDRLVVISRADNSPTRKARWKCKCVCGNVKILVGSDLKNRKIKSCGCLSRELSKERATKHGHANKGAESPTYVVWKNMLARTNPKTTSPHFKKYVVERGIVVCMRWCGEKGFENFLRDMGPRPGGTELDRINNNEGYFPENCRWTSHSINMQNTRRNYARYGKPL